MIKQLTLVALMLGSLFLAVSPAEAKKKAVSNGCSMSAIQGADSEYPAAKQCLDQLEQDVISGSATVHALYCNSGGHMLCCEYDASTGQVVPHSCDVIYNQADPRIFTHQPLSGMSLVEGGGDGAPAGGGTGGGAGGFDPGSVGSAGNAGMASDGGVGGVIY